MFRILTPDRMSTRFARRYADLQKSLRRPRNRGAILQAATALVVLVLVLGGAVFRWHTCQAHYNNRPLAQCMVLGPLSSGAQAGSGRAQPVRSGRTDELDFLGGFGKLGAPIGAQCEDFYGCDDGAFCDQGVCVQQCKSSDDKRGEHNHLCRCSVHSECLSHNCAAGYCRLRERMAHSDEKETELRKWHNDLATEETRDDSSVTCGLGGEGESLVCTSKPVKLAALLAFPIKSLTNALFTVRSWSIASFTPCVEGEWSLSQHVDLVIGVAVLGKSGASIADAFRAVLPPRVRRCFGRVYVIDLGLTPEEDDYTHAPPAMFHGAMNNSVLAKHTYTHMFWMEPDVFGVRPGWLQRLYRLATTQQIQGAWMVGSLQQHNRRMYGPLDYYHINGNALHAFNSSAYRMFLRRARLNHPNVFDYASQIWRTQTGPMHAHIAQQVTQRFVYTKFIQNHPADVCMETFEDFLARHPATYMVHSKALRSLIRCSDCCRQFPGGAWSPWRRESIRYSDQMRCLYYKRAPAPAAGGRPHMCDVRAMSTIVRSPPRGASMPAYVRGHGRGH